METLLQIPPSVQSDRAARPITRADRAAALTWGLKLPSQDAAPSPAPAPGTTPADSGPVAPLFEEEKSIELGPPTFQPIPYEPDGSFAEELSEAIGPLDCPAADHADADEAAGLMVLDAWIDHQADRFRALGTDAGLLVARTLAELARTVRFVQARTPAEAEGRIEVLERSLYASVA